MITKAKRTRTRNIRAAAKTSPNVKLLLWMIRGTKIAMLGLIVLIANIFVLSHNPEWAKYTNFLYHTLITAAGMVLIYVMVKQTSTALKVPDATLTINLDEDTVTTNENEPKTFQS